MYERNFNKYKIFSDQHLAYNKFSKKLKAKTPSSGCTENYIVTSCFLYKLRCSHASPQNRQCAMHNIVVHYLCGCVEFYFLFKIVVIKIFSIVQYIYCEARAKVNKASFHADPLNAIPRSIGLALSHILRCIQIVRVNLLRLKKKKKLKN